MSLCTITNIDVKSFKYHKPHDQNIEIKTLSCSSVQVLNNPAKLVSDLQFNITFEVLAELKEGIVLLSIIIIIFFFFLFQLNIYQFVEYLNALLDIEFKIIYVGSANNELHDQVLESIMVGPVPVGVNQFVFQVFYFSIESN